MAEIHVEKKKNNNWWVWLLVIIAIIALLWWLFDDAEAEGVEMDEPVTETAYIAPEKAPVLDTTSLFEKQIEEV